MPIWFRSDPRDVEMVGGDLAQDQHTSSTRFHPPRHTQAKVLACCLCIVSVTQRLPGPSICMFTSFHCEASQEKVIQMCVREGERRVESGIVYEFFSVMDDDSSLECNLVMLLSPALQGFYWGFSPVRFLLNQTARLEHARCHLTHIWGLLV